MNLRQAVDRYLKDTRPRRPRIVDLFSDDPMEGSMPYDNPKNLATYAVRLHNASDARMVGDRFRVAIYATHREGYDCNVLEYCKPTYDDVRRVLGY